ncbi:Crp/Fnr family transcriptional regulator [Namhaeicola litoreus]|uniref:Crp/Fnr family transcriptional regulator n=1 Tax=Namhaeicola litoreus TaxID=1052145 RepID=A0ABW3Y455_9FLAO
MGLTKDQIEELLQKHCPTLGKNDRIAFMEQTEYAHFESKEVILDNSLRQKQAFIILKGSIRGYFFDGNGEERNIILRSEGVFTGDANVLFLNEPKKTIFEAIAPTDVLIIDFLKFEKMIWENEGLMKLYINVLKDAVTVLTYRVNSMVSMSNEERYLDLLKKNPSFLKDSFNKHIANYLGITPVSLSRIIARLKSK